MAQFGEQRCKIFHNYFPDRSRSHRVEDPYEKCYVDTEYRR